MSFSGAPNVVYMIPGGSGNGSSWANAVGSLSAALGAVTGQALILIAPGVYENAAARATISSTDANIRIKGAGAGTVLRETENQVLITVDASNVELEDLTLINTTTSGNGYALAGIDFNIKQNFRLTRCTLRGGAIGAHLPFFKGVILTDSAFEGRTTALSLSGQSTGPVEEYSCLAFNSDFRAIQTNNLNSSALLVTHAELTGLNCNIAAIAAFTPNTDKRYIGVQVTNGGQAVLTNSAVSVDKGAGVSGGTATHDGFDVDGTSRLKLTACSVLAQGGGTANRSIVPNPGVAARMQADASLLTPAWSAA